MAIIESYSFGHMTIDGTSYSKDVIIFPDGNVSSPWFRNRGHVLEIADLADLLAVTPEIVVCGTGVMGFMRPSPAFIECLKGLNIDLIAQKNSQATKTYNLMSGKKKVGGCFHLTC